MTYHFRDVFAEAFHDYKRTQTWLQRAELARNDAAHPISGDMQTDDVSTALYDMVQLLTAADLAEAEAVAGIRSSVIGACCACCTRRSGRGIARSVSVGAGGWCSPTIADRHTVLVGGMRTARPVQESRANRPWTTCRIAGSGLRWSCGLRVFGPSDVPLTDLFHRKSHPDAAGSSQQAERC